MIPSVYNYLVTNYTNQAKQNNSIKVHKRSELRSIYNTIIKINKASPLYKVDLTKENQTYALCIKDSSLQLTETISSLYSDKDDSIFDKVKAYCEDDSSAYAHLVSDDKSQFPKPFPLKVISLATKQENESLSVPLDSMNPASGNYSFMITLDENNYSFQYKIKENTTNQETLCKLSDFINKSNIGLTCETKLGKNNTIQMHLVSDETGTTGVPIFELSDTMAPEDVPGLINYYGLNRCSTQAQNAQFEINGEDKESLSNQILLNKSLQITFLKPSTDASIVGYLPDSETILHRINQFQSEYNQIIDLAATYVSGQGTSQKLLYRLNKINKPYQNSLESCGITFDNSGKMQMDEYLSSQAIESKEMNALFSSNGYLHQVNKQLSSIIINPIEYVDKTLITYPDYANSNVSNPYVSSIYSGMLFNYYC
ncbi:MAG: hypothetical protein ACERKN_22035 [Velocimicrobium sp.]